MATQYKWFYRGDLDGFFGLFIDNLLQLMLISVLCRYAVGLPQDMVTQRILPGAALSILFGNVFYSLQAKRLAQRSFREHTTALPYGINTVSLFAHVFLIMAPVFRATQDPELAWKAGLFACLGSALIEIAGAFLGSWIRRNTPRAALLSALAGIALTFIAMGFVFQIFANPVLALVPAFLILFVYASRIRLPLGLPGGLVALMLGTAVAWISHACGIDLFHPSTEPFVPGLRLPHSSAGALWEFLSKEDGWKYLSVILPMGLFNVIGSLQNLESAEAAGDSFNTRSSLLMNGLGGLVAALLGSPFPTTIYIGHPAWKSMGARWGYSLLNGLVICAICLTGSISLVLRIVPLEVTLGILLWIGLVIAASAYKDVPQHHYIAVAFGLIPALAAWALLEIDTTLRVAGTDLYQAAPKFGDQIYIQGVLALNQGFIISSMIFAAVLVHVSELKFKAASVWCMAAALLSFFGIIHAYDLGPAGIQSRIALNAAPAFSAAYFACGVILLLLNLVARVEAGDGSWALAWSMSERRETARSAAGPAAASAAPKALVPKSRRGAGTPTGPQARRKAGPRSKRR